MNVNHKATLQKLEEFMDEWASQFENVPAPFLHFQVTANHLLSINGIILGPLDQICAEQAEYDAEVIYLPLTDGSHYEVGIHWPYGAGEKPRLGFIKHVSDMFRHP